MKSTYNGPNYCPNCSCNIRAVALALEAAKRIAEMGDLPYAPQNGDGIAALTDAPKRTSKTRRRTRMVITDEMRIRVLEMRAQKASIPEIEKATGMTRASISNTIYSKPKVEIRPKQIVPSNLKAGDKNSLILSRITELTNQHRPQIKIARELGISPKVVRRVQKEQGLSTTAGRPSEAAKASS